MGFVKINGLLIHTSRLKLPLKCECEPQSTENWHKMHTDKCVKRMLNGKA